MAIHVTFVLPSRGQRSGGARVTVEMAQRLQALGYPVRIAYRIGAQDLKQRLLQECRLISLKLHGIKDVEWLSGFQGRVEGYHKLGDLRFSPGEVVIAVGTMTVDDVYGLEADVLKVRFCHGFTESRPEQMRRVWGVPMRTICVSHTLIPRLEALSGGKVLAVIPNGIDTAEYYAEPVPRDGLGAIYYDHANKAPEKMLELFGRLRERWPAVPFYIFGEPPCPREIPTDSYWRLPPIDKARELYSRAKIWLLTSRNEGLPGPVLEAWACGAVVVSTDNEGSCELLRDGENGFLVPIDNVDAFIEPVARLLRDDELRHRMAAAGMRKVLEFTWDQAVRKMDCFLQSLAEDARAVSREGKGVGSSCFDG